MAWYRLGENDPGAASGLAVTNTTTDLLGLHHARQVGSPRYTNAVSPSASNGLGSSLAVHFIGTNQFFTNAIVSTATNNFGVEAWVKPNNTNAGFTYFIVQNGFTYAGSWSISQGNSYFGGFSDTNAGYGVGDGTAIASPGVWAHVALVRNNGTNRFYFNGTANGPPTTNAPIQPAGHFTIGGNFGTNILGTVSNSFFNGVIDEVRVFTFAPGQFSTNDLLFHALRAATLPATNLNFPNATLNGRAHPVGFPTSVWIEWGTSANYGNVTPVRALASQDGTTNLSETINSAFGGFTYHFRVVASNSLEIVYGADQSFAVPLFADIGAGLLSVPSLAAWGDYDNDGRLDVAASWPFQVYRNADAGFTNGASLGAAAIVHGSVSWGDYDNDERLDIIITGEDISEPLYPSTMVLHNTGGGFTNINTSLPRVRYSSGAWGDYDNDGRLDFVLAGSKNTNVAQVWRNTREDLWPTVEFTELHAGLTGVEGASASCGDYDNDGRLDILLTGHTNSSFLFPTSRLLRNTGHGFTNVNTGLPGIWFGSVAWGDYDNDGRLDILLTGATNDFPQLISQVWRNTGAGFTNINAGLPGVWAGSAAWGDYDNDGRLDILLAGATNGFVNPGGIPLPTSAICQVWRNTGNGFTNVNVGLTGVNSGSAAWGDYDNDGRLDILLTGYTNQSTPTGAISQIWRNRTPIANTPPTAPTGLMVTPGLSVTNVGTTVILSWNASSDAQTPASGLTYNVRIGTTPGGSEAMSAMSSSSGLRRLPQMGNAGERLFARFNAALATTYYWSVQAIDTAFAGGPFAPEQRFTINSVSTPTNGIPVPADQNGDGIVSESEFASVLANLNGNGIVSQAELDLVLSNYFPNSPFLYMTNVAGLGGTNVTFALTNSLAGAYSVEFSTNLVDWYFLGPAIPRYLFTDTNATALPQRYYRLRWP